MRHAQRGYKPFFSSTGYLRYPSCNKNNNIINNKNSILSFASKSNSVSNHSSRLYLANSGCRPISFAQPLSSVSTLRHQPTEEDMSKGNFQLKPPKGTRDFFGPEVTLRDEVFTKITNIFKQHGASALDTPVFELKQILTDKYGEDSKLIYDLKDQGGEICALRYDLTVPFARWAASNNIEAVKRYSLAKVYRRDQPAITRGRYREFVQCDIDIAGAGDPAVYDSEILYIVSEVFESLGLNVTIKLNHRKILDGLFAVSGVPSDKIRSISSAVDKLDKLSWENVKKEMVEEKGLPTEVADKIGEYVQRKGQIPDILEYFKANPALTENSAVKAGVDEMILLHTYLEAYGITSLVSFDLSLARGLDYYTGLIYEVIYNPSVDEKNEISSSIAAGGRYDRLINSLSSKNAEVPCCGISFGVERILGIIKAKREASKLALPRQLDVYIMAFGGKGFTGLLPERITIARQLWKSGIRADFSPKVKPKLPQQFKAAESGHVPVAVILGEDELAAGQVRLKLLGLPDGHPEKNGILVSKEDVVQEVQKLLEREEKGISNEIVTDLEKKS